MTSIRATLERIGVVEQSRVELFADRTRDREVPVWRDSATGVIFIDGFYVGDSEYEVGEYRDAKEDRNFEDWSDTKRRIDEFAPYFVNRRILDFGCGSGSFLRAVSTQAADVQGVELQSDFRSSLNANGIPCFANMADCSSVESIFMFHVLEHLPDPLPVLASARAKTAESRGCVIVEVPHARDLLLTHARSGSFKRFTLWSQHLVLHTRESLKQLLQFAGFNDVVIYGVQRYGLPNHLNWLAKDEPGGHKGALALLEDRALKDEYASALARIDANDTLVAIAQ